MSLTNEQNQKMITFNLKSNWFNLIKSGKKISEYRECKPYWKRVEKLKAGDKIIFCLGYPKKCDISKRLVKTFTKLSIVDGKNTDLNINKKVYKIDFK